MIEEHFVAPSHPAQIVSRSVISNARPIGLALVRSEPKSAGARNNSTSTREWPLRNLGSFLRLDDSLSRRSPKSKRGNDRSAECICRWRLHPGPNLRAGCRCRDCEFANATRGAQTGSDGTGIDGIL